MTKLGGPSGRKPTIAAWPRGSALSYRGIQLDDELFGPAAGPASSRPRTTEQVRIDRPNPPVVQGNPRGQPVPAPSKDRGLDTEATRLRELVAVVARQSVAAQEKIKAEYGAEIVARRRDIAELQKQLQQTDADLRQARDENRHRIEESAAVQAAFDMAHRELLQAARRLIETDKTLGVTQSRLKETEAALADANEDRSRLSAALDETNRTHLEEIAALDSRVEELQARSNETESLLEEARQTLAARDDELQTVEHRLAEATAAGDGNAEKLVDLTATLAERETQIADLEQSNLALRDELEQAHLALREENALLAEAKAARQSEEEAQHKIKDQDDLIQLLEQQIQTMRSAGDTQLRQLTVQLQRERHERTMAEAASEAGRKDVARLMHEIGVLRQRLNLPPPGPPAARAA